jgi:hypothetical protein
MRSAILAGLASLIATSADAADRDSDADRVQTIVERSSPRFAVCFGKSDPALPDRLKVVVRLRIATSGHVTAAQVEHAPHARLSSCVSSVARTLAFGSLRRGLVLDVPIVFVRD